MDDATPLKLVQLRYATDMLKSWQAVEVSQKTSSEEIQFDPEQGWKLLSLQLVVSDAAGNQTVINQTGSQATCREWQFQSLRGQTQLPSPFNAKSLAVPNGR